MKNLIWTFVIKLNIKREIIKPLFNNLNERNRNFNYITSLKNHSLHIKIILQKILRYD